jgi:hypothetical protein
MPIRASRSGNRNTVCTLLVSRFDDGSATTMTPDDDQERQRAIGQRVARLRVRRGLTRKAFGDLCGRSLSWVDKVESGERGLVRLPMLERVAEALQVPVEALTGDTPSSAGRTLDTFEVGAIRSALQSYGAISRVFRPASSGKDVPNLTKLGQHVTHAWTAFQNANWPQLGQRLPRLLADAQAAAASYSGTSDDGLAARTLLSQTYQVTASTLFKLKETDLAWLAAERSLSLAEQTGDDLLVSDAARRVAQGLMALEHHGQALELIQADIHRLEPGRGSASPVYLSMYGMLFLMGSVVAAKAKSGSTARDLLREGHSVAKQFGRDGNERFTAFGPTNVRLHQISVLLDLGDGNGAVEAAKHITPDGLARLPKERRANFYLDVARAHSLAGQSEAAVRTLLQADAQFPDEVGYRPAALELVGNLLHRTTGSLATSLQQLANKVGVVDGG